MVREIFNLGTIFGVRRTRWNRKCGPANQTGFHAVQPEQLEGIAIAFCFYARWFKNSNDSPVTALTICKFWILSVRTVKKKNVPIRIPEKWFLFFFFFFLLCCFVAHEYDCTWVNIRNDLMASFGLNESHGQASRTMNGKNIYSRYSIYRKANIIPDCASSSCWSPDCISGHAQCRPGAHFYQSYFFFVVCRKFSCSSHLLWTVSQFMNN